ncbi:2'-5' RNA ligase family protein [Zafaria sp. Z1313]|uniref:2'-5' RNA ligase family protein n=1 Tax=unclassified Zafaria TaxID=2828765 RepID=UPI002E768C35|nr:2'-5' RNA ligase family protein [Zafaria sp. J156]MEE1619888.1 2'-5' RNA ligase family protein [Zafaria sp. J156]
MVHLDRGRRAPAPAGRPWAAGSSVRGGRAPAAPAAAGNVGIVIPLPAPLSRELESWRASFGDPLAAVVPPHITLISGTASRDWAVTREHVRAVAAATSAFTVRLRGTGTFRPVTPVVYLKVADGWEECAGLHRALRSGPLAHDPEYDYHPHLTMAHDVTETGMDHAMSVLADYEAEFAVDKIGLFEHDSTGFWALREELHLGGTGDDGNGRRGRDG